MDFGNKFFNQFNQKEFIKYSPIIKGLKEMNEFSCLVERYFEDDISIMLGCYVYITTKSEKVLKKVYEFIKENHYENNYKLRDNWGGKLYKFDKLFEWWSDIKNKRNK
jgi:hypothetical protein